jgi:hypothetical protein
VTDSPRTAKDAEPETEAGPSVPRAPSPVDLNRVPKTGQAIPLPPDAVRLPNAVGDGTDDVRPTWLGVRTWAFM